MTKIGIGSRLAATLAGFALGAHLAYAQREPFAYPARPIRVLSPSSPGGGADTLTRAVMQKFNELTGHAAIVDNRSGANGVVAMNITAQAAPDGYTLFAAGNLIVLNGVLGKTTYDIRKTFDPVVKMTSQPYLLVINPSFPVNSVRELISYAKNKPNALSYGSSGAGSVIHLGTELMKSMAGISMVHVPYKGNAPAFVDLMSGQIQMLFTSGFGVASYLKSGRLKAIAVASRHRLQSFPDLPTVAESGLLGFELENAYALYAPAGTQPVALNTLNREITRVVNSPEMKLKLAADGADAPPPSTPAELKLDFIRQINLWENFIKTSGIKLPD